MLCATKGLQYRMIIIAKLAIGYAFDEIKNDIVRAISVGFTSWELLEMCVAGQNCFDTMSAEI